MKFYRVDWHDDNPTAQQTAWATTERHANRLAVEAGDTSRVSVVDVPTDKAGLLAFLDKHLWCDPQRTIKTALDR